MRLWFKHQLKRLIEWALTPEPVLWLDPVETFAEACEVYVPGENGVPATGKVMVFLTEEHNRDCECHSMDRRYAAVLEEGRWVKRKIPWRMY